LPYEYWRPVVPRIPDELLDCVIYLYPSKEAAEKGERFGGSGFLVSVLPAISGPGLPPAIYAVTNSHVIREGKSPVVRLNTQAGSTTVLDLADDQWIHHPDGDDVAICPLGLKDQGLYRYEALPCEKWLATKSALDDEDVGPGDEVFFVGRFVNHQGQQQNRPVARFGTIAMMPEEPVRNQRGLLVEAFLIEAHSQSGFSGSPVFMYIPHNSVRSKWWTDDESGIEATEGLRHCLLGIDAGHFPHSERVQARNEKTGRLEPWKDHALYVKQNSGMMEVVPVWKLADILEDETVAEMRMELWREYLANTDLAAAQDVSGDTSGGGEDSDGGDEFERFEDLTRKLVQTPKPVAE
jgi:hypothetical protein